MTETVLVGLITATSALLGVLITQRYESKKRESEERRWYADYFLGRKVDALNNLYAALVDCYFTMHYYGSLPPFTLHEFKEKIAPKEESFVRAKVMASIYLDNKAEDIMFKALGAFKQASMAIWLSLPDEECPVNKNSYSEKIRNMDWDRFTKTYEEAISCLKDLLNPKVFQQVRKHE